MGLFYTIAALFNKWFHFLPSWNIGGRMQIHLGPALQLLFHWSCPVQKLEIKSQTRFWMMQSKNWLWM